MNIKVPAELYPLFDNIDDAAAAFLFDTRFDATHPKIAETIHKLKQRCKTLEEFKDKLYDLDGANECLDNGAILPTQFQLIGKSIPADRCSIPRRIHERQPSDGICTTTRYGVCYVKGSIAPVQRHYHPDYSGELGRVLQH